MVDFICICLYPVLENGSLEKNMAAISSGI